MSTYQYAYDGGSSAYKYSLADHQVYGVGRIGTYKVDEILVTSPTLATNDPAKQFFEITDHLGSVRAVVSGVKTGSYNADIAQMTDYHEFGQTMQGRSFVSEAYRYGYQGSEKDGEINAGAYTTDFRMLDVRLGRWFTPDPIKHCSQSPYTSMDNDPVNLTDVTGLATGLPPGAVGSHMDMKGNVYYHYDNAPTSPDTFIPINYGQEGFTGGNTAGTMIGVNATKPPIFSTNKGAKNLVIVLADNNEKSWSNYNIDKQEGWDYLVVENLADAEAWVNQNVQDKGLNMVYIVTHGGESGGSIFVHEGEYDENKMNPYGEKGAWDNETFLNKQDFINYDPKNSSFENRNVGYLKSIGKKMDDHGIVMFSACAAGLDEKLGEEIGKVMIDGQDGLTILLNQDFTMPFKITAGGNRLINMDSGQTPTVTPNNLYHKGWNVSAVDKTGKGNTIKTGKNVRLIPGIPGLLEFTNDIPSIPTLNH